MVITPQNDCTWSYHDGKLSINLTTDDGKSYLFKTLFRVEDLFVRPEVNSQFCIIDAQLLTTYQEGVDRVLNNEDNALDLGLNAVACQRFTRPACPTSRYFMMNEECLIQAMAGDIVNLYAKCGHVGHCIVLDGCDADGLVRLMLLTDELILDPQEGRGYRRGMMIRVNSACVFQFSIVGNVGHSRYA